MITKLSFNGVRFGAIFALLAMFLSVGVGCQSNDPERDDPTAPEGPPQMPPQARAVMELPRDGESYMLGEPVTFRGRVANVRREEDIPESFFTWTSSIQGELGSGREFARDNLVAGEHRITLTVRDEFGYTIEDTHEIDVVSTDCSEFTLSVSPSTIEATLGGDGAAGVILTPIDGFSGAVEITWTQLDGHIIAPNTSSIEPIEGSTNYLLSFTLKSDPAVVERGNSYTNELVANSDFTECRTLFLVKVI